MTRTDAITKLGRYAYDADTGALVPERINFLRVFAARNNDDPRITVCVGSGICEPPAHHAALDAERLGWYWAEPLLNIWAVIYH